MLCPATLSYSVPFQGICFIRTSRPENAIIYNNNEDFQIGQAKVSAVGALETLQKVPEVRALLGSPVPESHWTPSPVSPPGGPEEQG